jgi:hypothetical protein
LDQKERNSSSLEKGEGRVGSHRLRREERVASPVKSIVSCAEKPKRAGVVVKRERASQTPFSTPGICVASVMVKSYSTEVSIITTAARVHSVPVKCPDLLHAKEV